MGEVFDSSGKKQIEIVGSWMDQISINWLNPKRSEVIWKEEPLMKNAEMMYHYNKFALLLNYKSAQMEGYVAPTDSRFRKD